MYCHGGRRWLGFFIGVATGAWAMNRHIHYKALYGESPWASWKQWHHKYHERIGPWGEHRADPIREILKEKTKMTDDEINQLITSKRQDKIFEEQARWRQWENQMMKQRGPERRIERRD